MFCDLTSNLFRPSTDWVMSIHMGEPLIQMQSHSEILPQTHSEILFGQVSGSSVAQFCWHKRLNFTPGDSTCQSHFSLVVYPQVTLALDSRGSSVKPSKRSNRTNSKIWALGEEHSSCLIIYPCLSREQWALSFRNCCRSLHSQCWA